jgi:hypothetical protein
MTKPGFPHNDLAVSLNRAALLNDPDAQVRMGHVARHR